MGKGKLLRNLFAVWLFTGIWHGAAWQFIVWGLMYGVLVTFEKFSRIPDRLRSRPAKGFYALLTLLIVNAGWVLFGAESLDAALYQLGAMLGIGAVGSPELALSLLRESWVFLAAGVLFSMPVLPRLRRNWPWGPTIPSFTLRSEGGGKMKKLFSFRYLTALCFLFVLAVFFALSLKPFLRETWYALRAGGDTAQAESNFNEFLPFGEELVTLNGGVERLLGRREVNQRYRLDNGQLTYVIPELDMRAIARNTADFSRELDKRGIPFLYCNLLFKVDEQDKQLPPGVEDFSNENADRFLALLREHVVQLLDDLLV